MSLATKDTMATTVPDDTDAKTKSEKKGNRRAYGLYGRQEVRSE